MAGCADCYFGGVKIESKGPEDSPFVIVGESPGAMEIHYKKPFVGDSGKVLQRVLEDQGIDALGIEPYYTNAIMCMPRRKDPERLSAACFRCRDRLVEEIKKHPRKIILALGNGALWSTTGDFGLKITKERGKLFRSPLSEMGIVAAVHPAFLLRGNGNYKQFQNDIKYAIDLCRDGEDAFKLPNGSRYRVLQSAEEAKEFSGELHNCPKGTLIAKDIETTGFNYVTDDILCMGFQHTPKLITIVPGELITEEMFTHRGRQGWHNGKFDIRFLRQRGFKARVDEDSMLLNYATNERRGIHDLDQVASDKLGSPNHKHIIDPYTKGTIIDAVTGKKRKRNYGDIPKDILYKYTALDLADTYQLIPYIGKEVAASEDLTRFYNDHLLDGSEYLTKVEMNGFLIDQEWVEKNSVRLVAEMDKFENILVDLSREANWGEVNPRSPKQLKSFLYSHLRLAPESWDTDDDTLEKLPSHPAVEALRGYRTVQKSYATYVRPLKAPGFISINKTTGKPKEEKSYLYPDGRVHTTFKLHGTATSRLSSTEPNIQNVPRDPLLRGMYIPDPGYCILEVDYSQAELRCLAVLSGDEGLLEIFNTGKDLHVEMSIFLFGPNFTKEDKMATKTVNFGIVYGRTAPSIAEDPKLVAARLKQGGPAITIQEAQGWIDGWYARFPKAKAFIDKCRMAPIREQTMTTCFGNKKRPGVVSREKVQDLQNESANFFHQSIASNLTIRAGIELFDDLRDNYDTHILNTVHDCIVTMTPLNSDHIKLVSDIMVRKMEEIPLRFRGLHGVPFKAEPEIGLRWGNLYKFKEVEQQFNWDLTKMADYVPAH